MPNCDTHSSLVEAPQHLIQDMTSTVADIWIVQVVQIVKKVWRFKSSLKIVLVYRLVTIVYLISYLTSHLIILHHSLDLRTTSVLNHNTITWYPIHIVHYYIKITYSNHYSIMFVITFYSVLYFSYSISFELCFLYEKYQNYQNYLAV